MRKTVKLTELIATANRMLASSVDSEQAGRLAVSVLLETVLFDHGAYAGFNYLASEFLPASEQTDTNALRPNHDDSRRRYFTHRNLVSGS